MYNGPEGLGRGKGRKTVSRAGARRLGQRSSPDVSPPDRHLRTPSPDRHLRTPIILTGSRSNVAVEGFFCEAHAAKRGSLEF